MGFCLKLSLGEGIAEMGKGQRQATLHGKLSNLCTLTSSVIAKPNTMNYNSKNELNRKPLSY